MKTQANIIASVIASEANVAKQVRKAYELTCKKNPDASTCAIVRSLAAATKKMAHVQRKHFIEGLRHDVNVATIATQFQVGRTSH